MLNPKSEHFQEPALTELVRQPGEARLQALSPGQSTAGAAARTGRCRSAQQRSRPPACLHRRQLLCKELKTTQAPNAGA